MRALRRQFVRGDLSGRNRGRGLSEPNVNISSVILRARPEKLGRVRNDLAAIPGVEIHADGNDGRLVLTIEDGEGYAPADVFLKLRELDGVISASLVYQYCDDGLPQEKDK